MQCYNNTVSKGLCSVTVLQIHLIIILILLCFLDQLQKHDPPLLYHLGNDPSEQVSLQCHMTTLN